MSDERRVECTMRVYRNSEDSSDHGGVSSWTVSPAGVLYFYAESTDGAPTVVVAYARNAWQRFERVEEGS